MKYVTIATDVSCDSDHEISTWACYIRHNGGAIKHVGRFKEYYSDTAKAETYALINALTIAKSQIPDWENSKIIIYNEVERALTPVTTKAGRVRVRDKDRAEAISEIAMPILKLALEWERRKIKAHFSAWRESDNPAKYAINRWCDQNSRKELRRIRGIKSVQ